MGVWTVSVGSHMSCSTAMFEWIEQLPGSSVHTAASHASTASSLHSSKSDSALHSPKSRSRRHHGHSNKPYSE